ncbi:DNA-binding GntR family transcriptional regulator [Skermanella aerolata]|uniref:GntR family transcriptional regulator n=1 Tax=Skermanella aerolata TaxID=393310 RepID=A0A512DMT1_9PROT|nr:GntR family transcriptional regulator [Skermanella aerolata]KJB96664.1 GntR family transcriptional regulator [Skermanella aerolata KACC 11604]GEO37779.1 GntR family transcriptional regulator [Skermanella aerolata]
MTSTVDHTDGAKPARRGGVVLRSSRRGATMASVVFRELRDEIVSMRRKPGEAIAEKQIAESYGVSRTPVREAVLRLADDGLVEVFPQSGTYVSRIPLYRLPEAIVIRKTLEEGTVRHAASRATAADIRALRANLELQERMRVSGDHEGFHQSDEAFHALLAEISGYPGFWTVIQQVKVQVDRCRRLTLPEPGRLLKVISEHTAVVEAIAAHDPERAVKSIAAHLDGLRTAVDAVSASHHEYFTREPE